MKTEISCKALIVSRIICFLGSVNGTERAEQQDELNQPQCITTTGLKHNQLKNDNKHILKVAI